MMKIAASFFLIVVTTLGGCMAGYAVGSNQGNPADMRWEQLPDPPELPVGLIEIGGLGRNASSVIVETVSGKQYECCRLWPKVWEETAYIKTPAGDSCPASQDYPLDQAPGNVVDCAYVVQWEWATEQHYVVLLEDGSLWRWRYYESVIVQFQAMIWGTLAGLVVGTAIIYWRRKQNA